MGDFLWRDAYYSDLQSLYGLLVVPIVFLVWRFTAPADGERSAFPAAARFVSGMTLFFAFETMVDPIATGPLLETELLRGTLAATLIPFTFVLLGDFRVLMLAIGVARPERGFRPNFAWALGTSLVVPAIAGCSFGLARWFWPDIHGQVLWMIYEFGFFALALFLARVWVPRTTGQDSDLADFLRSIFAYSAVYYALWWLADVVIVVAELDLGWAIRMVPNQLYYAFWVPFVYWRFFRVPSAKASA